MFKRFRKLRNSTNLRALVRETSLSTDDLIYPLFVIDGEGKREEISSMKGVFRLSIDELLKECEELKTLKIRAIILFAVLEEDKKDSCGSDALDENGLCARAIRAIKAAHPDLTVITDLCFCEYTDHGHCGILDPKTGSVDNDKTLEISLEQALVHAKAGADMIAPSGMMDGIVPTLRIGLDKAGFKEIPIMSYSTKFASAFYGPFRHAANSAPSHGDRKGYQMDYANGKEALLESLEDERGGADILMIKPALVYLDVVKELSYCTKLPICVYNVSGEYSILQAAREVIDYDKIVMEEMIAFKRAGATLIITYHAKEVARMLEEK